MYNIYLPIPLEEQHDWQWCQIGDCEETAAWQCLPQGFLSTSILLCDQHKHEAEQQERERDAS